MIVYKVVVLREPMAFVEVPPPGKPKRKMQAVVDLIKANGGDAKVEIGIRDYGPRGGHSKSSIQVLTKARKPEYTVSNLLLSEAERNRFLEYLKTHILSSNLLIQQLSKAPQDKASAAIMQMYKMKTLAYKVVMKDLFELETQNVGVRNSENQAGSGSDDSKTEEPKSG
jgi:hypothetical protein